MMTKTRKAFIGALSVLCIVCLGVFTLTACSKTKVLESIAVDTTNAKTVYISGEELDTEGLIVTATFKVGEDKTKDKVLKADEYVVSDVKLTLATGQFQSTKKVTVSYTYGEETKTASYNVTVTKKVISVRIDRQPDKTEYYVGEKFDPTGLKITATFEDNSNSQIEITADNATWTPNAELSKGTKKITVTYGGYSFDVNIEMINAVYIEAEQGLYNGRPVSEVEADLEASKKKTRTDASLSDAKSGAETLYRAHLNAIKAEDIEDKVAAYKAGTNDDIDEWNYQYWVERFHASDDLYLGEIGIGDTVSFVFSSSEATTGDIAFRLASGYLKKDNNWSPIEMGDIDFSKLCNMYVNGVQKVINEGDVILEGGKTEDGSTCQQLWVLWSLVTFDDIDFVAGRNVIELKFKDCGLKNSKNTTFTCNVDSLIITPADDSTADIDLYDNTKVSEDLNNHVVLSTIAIDKDELTLTVTGLIAGGYYVDVLNLTAGTVVADLTLDKTGLSFTAIIDLNDLDFGEAAIKLSGVALKKGVLTLPDKVTCDDLAQTSYEILEKGGDLYLVKQAEKMIALKENSFAKGNKLNLVAEGGKVYYVIEGSTFDCEIIGYDDGELASLPSAVTDDIAAKINSYISFDLQANPNAGHSNNSWPAYVNKASDRQIIVDVKNKTFTIKIDITSVPVGPYTNHYDYIYNKTSTDGWNDFKPTGVTKPDGSAIGTDHIVVEVTEGGKKYQIFYHEKGGDGTGKYFWDNVGIIIANA